MDTRLFFIGLVFTSLAKALPQIEKSEDVINKSENWTVKCKGGQRQVLWEYPTEAKARITIESSREKPFVTTLTLTEAHFMDTGEYICKYRVSADAAVSRFPFFVRKLHTFHPNLVLYTYT